MAQAWTHLWTRTNAHLYFGSLRYESPQPGSQLGQGPQGCQSQNVSAKLQELLPVSDQEKYSNMTGNHTEELGWGKQIQSISPSMMITTIFALIYDIAKTFVGFYPILTAAASVISFEWMLHYYSCPNPPPHHQYSFFWLMLLKMVYKQGLEEETLQK